jgi:multisubunit Na+/H+ antiporter MnhE subunit
MSPILWKIVKSHVDNILLSVEKVIVRKRQTATPEILLFKPRCETDMTNTMAKCLAMKKPSQDTEINDRRVSA